MDETPQQYSRRLLSYVGDKKPMTILGRTPSKLARLIRRVPKSTLCRKPGRKRWSVADILAHLAESEILIAYRLRMIAGVNRVHIQAMDQNLWQENARELNLDPAGALEAFRILRRLNIGFVRSLPGKLRKNYGIHEERGKESIEHIVRLTAGHDINHLNQIRKILTR